MGDDGGTISIFPVLSLCAFSGFRAAWRCCLFWVAEVEVVAYFCGTRVLDRTEVRWWPGVGGHTRKSQQPDVDLIHTREREALSDGTHKPETKRGCRRGGDWRCRSTRKRRILASTHKSRHPEHDRAESVHVWPWEADWWDPCISGWRWTRVEKAERAREV
jgi:hypothetical protein